MKIVFTPDWFLGHDVFIDVFSFIILFLFFLFSIKGYKLNKNKKSLYLGIGFLLIALAELSVILTKFAIFYDTILTSSIGGLIVTYQVVNSVDIVYYLSFFFNRLFTLAGLYIIYRLPLKRLSGDVVLVSYFILISAWVFHNFYYLYYLTTLIFLALIIRNYLKIYRRNNLANTMRLITAFSLLAISQIMFVFSKINSFYVTAQIIQLISYITLLILIVKITQNGKKKQDKHNL